MRPTSSFSTGLNVLGALVALLLPATTPAVAQSSGSSIEVEAPVPVASMAIRTGEIRIDGRIDEAVWEEAPLISGFVQSEPLEGAPASRETHVRILLDDEAIYVAARMLDDPADVVRVLNRRDELGGFFDWIGVSFDPDLTYRNAYHFRVNAAGVQADLYVSDDTRQDVSWDAVWESAVQNDSEGWSAEFRIPLSQLRYEAGSDPKTWGFNVHRRLVATGELVHFSVQSRQRSGMGGGFFVVSQFGLIENVMVPSPSRRIEMRPYALSSLHRGPAEVGDPFFDGSSAAARVGSDLRLGLGSSFTLDATVSPDFGQVEADPAVINLSAFETRFDERRPFFVEGAQVFDFRLSGMQNELFYSRRIGRSPTGSAPDGADFSEMPDATTILGAAKLTGRTSSGISVGALAAVTRREEGRAYFLDEGETVRFRAEPRTEYGVVSARQDFNGGASQVSGIFSAVRRALPGTGEFDHLPSQAYSTGARFEHQWGERVWRLSGFLAGSHVRGDSTAMVAIQRASNHYRQRPDATRYGIDSTATSLSGAEWRLQFDRQNTAWTGSVWLAEVTNGFEVNDVGFSGVRERIDGGFRAGYLQIQPGRIFRDYRINFFTFYNFSHEALDDPGSWDSWRRSYTNGNFNLNTDFTLLNYHGGNVNLSWRPDTYSHVATRGGPVMLEPGRMGLGLGASTDRRRPYSLNLNVDLDRQALDSGGEVSLRARIQMRPTPPLQIEVQPRFSMQSDGSQYVTATDVLPYDPTFGRRYFFGDLERKSASIEARVNYAFSPVLSLQIYTQGLLSSGDYVRYKQLVRPGTFSFQGFAEGQASAVDGIVTCNGGTICRTEDGFQNLDLNGDGVTDFRFSDRNFNVRSLIGNAVLRWEYRPGSTIFLVWQRQQEGEVELGDFDFGRDLGALWGLPAHNRFIVKMNYWLGL